jgi:hypothetical protein
MAGRITSLAHHITRDRVRKNLLQIPKWSAAGVDGHPIRAPAGRDVGESGHVPAGDYGALGVQAASKRHEVAEHQRSPAGALAQGKQGADVRSDHHREYPRTSDLHRKRIPERDETQIACVGRGREQRPSSIEDLRCRIYDRESLGPSTARRSESLIDGLLPRFSLCLFLPTSLDRGFCEVRWLVLGFRMHRLQIGEPSRRIGTRALSEAGAPGDAPADPIQSNFSFECAQGWQMKQRHYGLLDLLHILVFFFWPAANRGRPAVKMFDQYEDLGQGCAPMAWNRTAVTSARGTFIAASGYRAVKKQLSKFAFEFAQSLIEVASCRQSLDNRRTFESPVRTVLAFVHDGYPKEQVGQGQAVRSLVSLGFRAPRGARRLRLIGTSDIRRATFDARLCHDLFPMPRPIIGMEGERLPNAQKSSGNEALSKSAKISEFQSSVLVGVAYCLADHGGRGSLLMFLFWIFSWLVSARCEVRARLITFGAEALVERTRAVGRRLRVTKPAADRRFLNLGFAPAGASTRSAWNRLDSQIRRRDRLVMPALC